MRAAETGAVTARTSLVSVIAPVYNERECLEELVRRIDVALQGRPCEIILVDDGSRDGSWGEIVRLRALYPAVRGLRFSRNFGHHVAITAGLDHALGEWVVVMDSDLQDQPESITSLLDKAAEGYHMVVARRLGKRHGPFKRSLSQLFARAMTWLADFEFDASVGVFRVMHRDIVDAVCAMRETPRLFTAMTDWVGFSRTSIDVTHGARFAGETKYPLRKQVALAVRGAIGFSEKPLEVLVTLGFVIASVGLTYALVIAVRALQGGIAVLGYASLMSAILVMGGLAIATTGIVGLYVGSVFAQTKRRPLYLLRASEGIETSVLPPSRVNEEPTLARPLAVREWL
nr:MULTISPECIES: glycosyltransferase family 2 protein [Ramlibacter]